MRLGKRDRWEDDRPGRTPNPDAVKELRHLVDRFADRRQQLTIAQTHLEGCEQEEAEVDQAIADAEFGGSMAPDTAAAKRREVVERARAAREIRDAAKKFVEAGERVCEQQVDKICEANIDAAEAGLTHVRDETAKARERIVALGAAEQLLNERIESYGYSGVERLKLRALFSADAESWLWREQIRRQAAREFPGETPDQTVERIHRETLAVQTADPDTGEPVPAYVKLPTDGAVRIS
jgi:hypothetical protein